MSRSLSPVRGHRLLSPRSRTLLSALSPFGQAPLPCLVNRLTLIFSKVRRADSPFQACLSSRPLSFLSPFLLSVRFVSLCRRFSLFVPFRFVAASSSCRSSHLRSPLRMHSLHHGAGASRAFERAARACVRYGADEWWRWMGRRRHPVENMVGRGSDDSNPVSPMKASVWRRRKDPASLSSTPLTPQRCVQTWAGMGTVLAEGVSVFWQRRGVGIETSHQSHPFTRLMSG